MAIFCGYQGVGKSTYCRNHPTTTVDLDSSAFKKVEGWESNYVELAKKYSEAGKVVFISAHKTVIEYCMKNNVDFSILAPILNRNAWLRRLQFRYEKNPILPNLKAIRDFEENFEADMEYYKNLEENHSVKVNWVNARIVTTIEDFI